MRTITETFSVYSVNELPEKARAKAIEAYANFCVESCWYEGVLLDFKELVKQFGVDIYELCAFDLDRRNISIKGAYQHVDGAVDAIKRYAPNECRLIAIAETLEAIQKRVDALDEGTKIEAAFIATRDNWLNDTTHIEAQGYIDWSVDSTIDRNQEEAIAEEVESALEDLPRILLHKLQKDFDYLTSEEGIIEALTANEFEFLEDGRLYIAR